MIDKFATSVPDMLFLSLKVASRKHFHQHLTSRPVSSALERAYHCLYVKDHFGLRTVISADSEPPYASLLLPFDIIVTLYLVLL